MGAVATGWQMRKLRPRRRAGPAGEGLGGGPEGRGLPVLGCLSLGLRNMTDPSSGAQGRRAAREPTHLALPEAQGKQKSRVKGQAQQPLWPSSRHPPPISGQDRFDATHSLVPPGPPSVMALHSIRKIPWSSSHAGT